MGLVKPRRPRTLYEFRELLLELLTKDVIAYKKSYKFTTESVNGRIVKKRIYLGKQPIVCKQSDWTKGSKNHRGKAARERVRLIIQLIRKEAKNARLFSLDMDNKK